MKIKRKPNKRRRKLISQFQCPFCLQYFIKLVSPMQKYISDFYAVCPHCNKGHAYEYDYGQ